MYTKLVSIGYEHVNLDGMKLNVAATGSPWLLVGFVDHHRLGFGNLSTNVLVHSTLGVCPKNVSCGLKCSGTLEFFGERVAAVYSGL